MYATTHYFTITADHLAGTPLTINERQEAQQRLYEKLNALHNNRQNREHWCGEAREQYANPI